MVLAVPSVLSGYLGFNWQSLNFFSPAHIKFDGTDSAPLANHFAAFIHFGNSLQFEGMNGLIMLVSTAFAFFGFALAAAVYFNHRLNINTNIATSKQPLIAFLYKFSYDKWRFDEVYLWLVNGLFLPAANNVWQTVDKYIVDNLVDFSGSATLFVGNQMRYLQNGRGQYYALIIFASVAGLTLLTYLFKP